MAVIAIHAALLIAFLNLSGRPLPGRTTSVLHIIDVSDIPVERQKKPPPPPLLKARSNNRRRQKSSTTNRQAAKIASKTGPTDETALEAANQPPAVTAPVAAASQSGTGAAGSGTANGGGNGGNGAGGGTGGIATPPRLQTPPLNSSDVANGHAREWPRGATIFLRLRIDNRGYIAECLVDRGSGVAPIDGAICNLALDRLRFSPALNYHGEAVAGWFGYAQPAPR